DDVGMRYTSHSARLSQCVFARTSLVNELDRDVAPELRVGGSPNFPQCPLSNASTHDVAPIRLTVRHDSRRGCVGCRDPFCFAASASGQLDIAEVERRGPDVTMDLDIARVVEQRDGIVDAICIKLGRSNDPIAIESMAASPRVTGRDLVRSKC